LALALALVAAAGEEEDRGGELYSRRAIASYSLQWREERRGVTELAMSGRGTR
jgi:hypothetical protein